MNRLVSATKRTVKAPQWVHEQFEFVWQCDACGKVIVTTENENWDGRYTTPVCCVTLQPSLLAPPQYVADDDGRAR